MDYNKVRCPVAEAICRTAIHTTIRQHMSTEHIRGVAKAIAKVAEHYAKCGHR